MTITYFSELSLFTQEFVALPKTETRGNGTNQDMRDGTIKQKSFKVTYTPPQKRDNFHHTLAETRDSIEIPLEPEVDRLVATGEIKRMEVNMHQSPTEAYMMPARFSEWFSEKLGWNVILAYLGPHRRAVLGNVAPKTTLRDREIPNGNDHGPTSWLGNLGAAWSGLSKSLQTDAQPEARDPAITFADIAAYLVVTEESLAEVSSRLPEGVEMDVTKFRPNIVLSGAQKAWEEDFWGGIAIHTMAANSRQDQQNGNSESEQATKETAEIILTSNCGRCVSVNIDYTTGKAGAGEEGKILKKLSKDRRVDPGNKWCPIFGRYGFLRSSRDLSIASENKNTSAKWVRVGSEVDVSVRNDERTVFGRPHS